MNKTVGIDGDPCESDNDGVVESRGGNGDAAHRDIGNGGDQ